MEKPLFSITGVNVQQGMAMTGGTNVAYRKVLSMFCKDANARLQLLRLVFFEGSMGGGDFPEKYISSFITQVHALKSASASLGAAELSMEAGRLEEAVKIGDLSVAWENLNDFIEHLAGLMQNISEALELVPEGPTSNGEQSAEAEVSMYFPLFRELAEAIKSLNIPNIDHILNELNQKAADSKTKEALELISDQVLMAEFDSAIKTIDSFIDSNN